MTEAWEERLREQAKYCTTSTADCFNKLKTAYEAGQKEVVEYIDKNYPIGTPKWAAQKKLWGLE